MKGVYSSLHTLHCPPLEMEFGTFRPFKETPNRIEIIITAFKNEHLGDLIVSPRDYGIEKILVVHSKCYIEYLQTAWKDW